MKSKNKKKIILWSIAIIIIIAIVIVVLINKSKKSEESGSTQTIVETQASTQTIQKTLTGSGQIVTSNTEKLKLTTTRYFSTMCVEEGDIVSEGENILKYTNGTYLTAPYDCIISSYSVPSTGSICTSSNYVEIENTKTLNMTLSINESEINSVKVGQAATITVNAVEGKTYEGTITKIDAIGTYSSSGSTFTATIEFENDGNVKLGMSASCEVVLQEAKDCIAVPIAAVQTTGDSKYVIVVKEDGSTENVNIETGISSDNYVEVKSGLDGSETIQMLQITSSSKRSYSSSSSDSMGGKGMMSQNRGEMSGSMSGGMQQGQQGPGGNR